MSFSIYHDLVIGAPATKVFESVTLPKHLENWWPKRCTGAPRLGETYNFFFTPEYDWYGMVSKLEPNASFHIKMTKSDADWDPTSFGFDLENVENGVLLKFWHTGWPECNPHFRRSSYCWALLLKGLKDYVEKGIVVPSEERS